MIGLWMNGGAYNHYNNLKLFLVKYSEAPQFVAHIKSAAHDKTKEGEKDDSQSAGRAGRPSS